MSVPRSIRLTALFGFLTVSAVTACNVSSERPPGVEDMDVQPLDAGDAGHLRCVAGDTRACKVQLPSHNGVNSCFVGVTICLDGQWSDCMSEGDVEKLEKTGVEDAGGGSDGGESPEAG